MTKPMMDLRALVEKSADADLLREMIGFAAERLMELEVGARTGAEYGEKSPDRLAQGLADPGRHCRTAPPAPAQRLVLSVVPRATASRREGADRARHCRSDQWRDNGSLQEACVHGVSTRAMDDLVQAMGGTGVSRSQVSRLCQEIDDRVDAFLTRPIEGEWPYLWIDATYLKVRQGGRIVSVASCPAARDFWLPLGVTLFGESALLRGQEPPGDRLWFPTVETATLQYRFSGSSDA